MDTTKQFVDDGTKLRSIVGGWIQRPDVEAQGWVKQIKLKVRSMGMIADRLGDKYTRALACQSSTLGVGAPRVDPKVTKTVNLAEAAPGDKPTWTLKVSNNQGIDRRDLKVRDASELNSIYGYRLTDLIAEGVDAVTVKVVKKPDTSTEVSRDGNKLLLERKASGVDLIEKPDGKYELVPTDTSNLSPKNPEVMLHHQNRDVDDYVIEGVIKEDATGDSLANTAVVASGQYEEPNVKPNDTSSAATISKKPSTMNVETWGYSGKAQDSNSTTEEVSGYTNAGKDLNVMFKDMPAGTTYSLRDPNTGESVTSYVIPDEGTYTIINGIVEFVADATFVVDPKPATVLATSSGGKVYEATYTPHVIGLSIDATPAITIDQMNTPQRSDDKGEGDNGKTREEMFSNLPESGNIFTLNPDGTVTVPSEGTYTIDENGVVTFNPEEGFVGKAKGVTVKVTTKDGRSATAKYTPTVIKKATSDMPKAEKLNKYLAVTGSQAGTAGILAGLLCLAGAAVVATRRRKV
ncbi:MAG: LPXTG cell wall anchor domain-containing protein [Actinomycetaceae bacterium]|nr:LPXTG cell wall anchor domain-containing protein [Actinomycetaceae bacterium]